jgi:hypothetical protein
MTLSVSNQVSLRYKLEGTYPTNFGVLQGGNGTVFNYTGESLSYDLVNVTSKTIRSDRSVADIAQVDANAGGGFKVEQIAGDIDWILAAVMQNPWVPYGTAGLSTSIASLAVTGSTLTASVAPTGGSAFTTLQAGQFFSIKPSAGLTTAQNAYLAKTVFRVHATTAPTATVITLDASTPFNTTLIPGPLVNCNISSSSVMNGTALQTFSIEAAHLDISQFRQYLGMAINSVELTFASGAIVEIAVELMGRTMVLAATTGMGSAAAATVNTPANATKGIMDIIEGGALMSAITYIKSGKLKISNNMRAQEAVSVFGAAGIASGTLEVTGSFEVYFADATHYSKALNGSASAIAIPVVDVNGKGYTYSVPAIKYTSAKVNSTGENTDTMLSMDFQGIVDLTATNATLNKTVAIYRH